MLHIKNGTNCTDFASHRFSGRSRFGWNPLPSCRNYLCCNAPARQILSRPTTSLRWVYIERYISPTGFTDTSLKDFSMRSQFLLELSRPSCIRTFSTSTTRSKSSQTSKYPIPSLLEGDDSFYARVMKGKKFALPV